MTENKSSALGKFTDKLYGGIKMSWLKVILFAVCTAVLTSVFLIVSVFKDTSFERMGVHLEAWILFAIIIMANCEKPLESALKTFVFFLISQPLIYLIQVPFTHMGWGIFGYYKYWGFITILTFPAAFIGWYIKKKNWLSLVIIAPILCLLAYYTVGAVKEIMGNFPHLIITAIFCIIQIILYVYAFTGNTVQRIVGAVIPTVVAVVIGIMILGSPVDVNANMPLPDNVILTDNATVEVEDKELANISISATGEDTTISIHATKYGESSFTIKDGDKEYNYSIKVYEENGTGQVEVNPK
ncbi:MAG: hypothetical protein K6D02_03000 [Lachnospiraceae bacterium]|nr:hypothetical protein [Lachnospiraceae bacterium]